MLRCGWCTNNQYTSNYSLKMSQHLNMTQNINPQKVEKACHTYQHFDNTCHITLHVNEFSSTQGGGADDVSAFVSANPLDIFNETVGHLTVM